MSDASKWPCKIFKNECPISEQNICSRQCFFEASLDKLEMGIVVLEKHNFNFLFYNKKAKQILSVYRDLFFGFLKEDLKRFSDGDKEFPVSGTIKYEEVFLGYTCYKLEKNYFIVFFRDITKYENTRMIDQNKMIYEKYNKIISEIIHEIGNPIAGIMSTLQIIQINFDEYSKEEIGRKVSLLLNETHRLKEILDLLRPLGSNSVSSWNRCNLNQFLNKLIKNYTDLVSITLKSIPKNWYAIIREDDLKKVFDELIENTLKYAGEKAQVTINLFKGNPFYFKMIFEDNGPGIPSGLLEKIFSPFFTTSPSNSKGMGLTIARKRMLNMGGMIFAEQSQKGARFVLYIPLEDYIYELFGPVG